MRFTPSIGILFLLLGLLAGALAYFSLSANIFTPNGLIIVVLLFLFLTFLFATKITSKRPDLFSPTIGFVGLYIVYFSIGMSLPIIWFAGEVPYTQWFYYILALICFIFGNILAERVLMPYYLRRSVVKPTERLYPDWSRGRIKLAVVLLFIVGNLFMAKVIVSRGIPFFTEISEKRFATKVSGYELYLGLMLQVSVLLGVFYLFITRRFRVWLLLVILGGTGVVFLYGSRAQVAPIMVLVFLCYNYLIRKISLKAIVVIGLIFFVLMALFGMLRVEYTTEAYQDRLEELNFPPSLYMVAPGFFTIRAPIDTFKLILEDIPGAIGFFKGKVLLSPFLTVLPGEQMLGQYIVQSDILMQDPAEHGPAALSFPVPFYVDFGIPGIIIGMIFAGFLIGFLYVRMRCLRRELDYLLYFFVFTEYCIWIYGGFFPTLIIVWKVFLIILLHFFASKKFLKLRKPA